MTDARALAALQPDMTAIAEWSLAIGASGTTVFAVSGEPSSAIHVRSFAPAHAIPEDPVCGTGNLSVAAHVGKRFGAEYIARQGMQMGRDGRVWVRIGKEAVELGGHAVTGVDGTIAC
jgi:PhzF family phenazine biosynthesis protein